MNTNILLCGVGGQGTVLASKLLAQAGMQNGLFARTAETIGMAQRGGSVVSHVRIGDEKTHSPLIPKNSADLIIAFEPAEAVRNIDYLKKDGAMVVAKKAIMPVTASLLETNYNADEMLTYLNANFEKLIIVDTDKICDECGSPKVMNVALLGACVAFSNEITTLNYDNIKLALTKKVKEAFLQMNLKALKLGNMQK
ncbi:MAG: indolepyruvate oxidoreductase subunit beta [Oscillospiraceae bacterium]